MHTYPLKVVRYTAIHVHTHFFVFLWWHCINERYTSHKVMQTLQYKMNAWLISRKGVHESLMATHDLHFIVMNHTMTTPNMPFQKSCLTFHLHTLTTVWHETSFTDTVVLTKPVLSNILTHGPQKILFLKPWAAPVNSDALTKLYWINCILGWQSHRVSFKQV